MKKKSKREFEKNFKNEVFEQCHSAEKCKRGTLLVILTSIALQNIETNEGRQKKSHSAEKNPSEKNQRLLSMFSVF